PPPGGAAAPACAPGRGRMEGARRAHPLRSLQQQQSTRRQLRIGQGDVVANDRGPPLEVAEVTSAQALEALRPEWTRLWQRSPHATPFQFPDWLLTWWNLFGRGRLLALILHREGSLAGIAPLFIDSDSEAERGESVRPVLVVGTGVTDHLDALVEPGLDAAAGTAILAHLEAGASRWDVLDFQQLR